MTQCNPRLERVRKLMRLEQAVDDLQNAYNNSFDNGFFEEACCIEDELIRLWNLREKLAERIAHHV